LPDGSAEILRVKSVVAERAGKPRQIRAV